MPRSNKANQGPDSDFGVLQGGSLPENVVKRHFADLKRKLAAESKEKAALRQQRRKVLEPDHKTDRGG